MIRSMYKRKHVVVVSVLAFVLQACAKQVVYVQPNQIASQFATEERVSQFFFHGVAQTDHVDAAQVCGGIDRVAKIETQTSGFDVILTFVTAGIYSPRTWRVYCLSVALQSQRNARDNGTDASASAVRSDRPKPDRPAPNKADTVADTVRADTVRDAVSTQPPDPQPPDPTLAPAPEVLDQDSQDPTVQLTP